MLTSLVFVAAAVSATHPGNLFRAGESVVVTCPAGEAPTWQLMDYEERVVASGAATTNELALGKLPVGYYELHRPPNRVSLGVFAPVKTPPATSPIGVDVAMAWFYKTNEMATVAELCAKLGVNWVRDRLSWPEQETKRGQWVANTRYDAAVQAQSAAGLKVLETMHFTPKWAGAVVNQFPTDLRDAHEFYRVGAERWRGSVPAFEPWNEPDHPPFGAHTGSEIATLQKVAYFGLKAGNPAAVVCSSSWALPTPGQLEDFAANEAGAYFDRFTFHFYGGVEQYPAVFSTYRAVAAGKPMWLTECNIPQHWQGDETKKELPDAVARLASTHVAPIFATALHEGVVNVFYFMLPHYPEEKIQYGMLRPDLTPRPALLAFAAVARLLADAKPLGRWESSGYWFRTLTDGKPHDVLVVWSAQPGEPKLPATPVAIYDHLGRATTNHAIGPAAKFFLYPSGTAKQEPVTAPPLSPARPCPVVFQAILPNDRKDPLPSLHKIPAGQPYAVEMFAYNFGQQPARGTVQVQVPAGWQVDYDPQLTVEPAARQAVRLTVTPALATTVQTVRVTGDFGATGQAVLSLRLICPNPESK